MNTFAVLALIRHETSAANSSIVPKKGKKNSAQVVVDHQAYLSNVALTIFTRYSNSKIS